MLFSAGSILGNTPAHHRSSRRLISTLPFLITEGKFEISRGATLEKWSRIRLFGGGGGIMTRRRQMITNLLNCGQYVMFNIFFCSFKRSKGFFAKKIHLIGRALIYFKAAAVVVYLRCQIAGLWLQIRSF